MKFQWKQWGISAAIFALSIADTFPASAQQMIRQGRLTGVQIREIAQQPENLSVGDLPNLAQDPNFEGDLQGVNDLASRLLTGFVIVNRGGDFPENQGIPLDRQFLRTDVAFALMDLGNGRELVVWQSPQRPNARYLIRPSRSNPAAFRAPTNTIGEAGYSNEGSSYQ
ncbi:hypothetical protein [Leptolyngbya ohadii]|uniref:hypothetical protein n=1 Tax=Leptolyngbya ohadii TaxID=1962290 RepID=UPI000B5A0ACB|nr:hypothetical protein [Leptolyngbya ohadii]